MASWQNGLDFSKKVRKVLQSCVERWKTCVTNVATVIREKFDYTRWQREYFDGMSPERISQEAEKFEQDGHPA